MTMKDGELRAAIAALLREGLITESSPVPVRDAEVADVLRALREVATEDERQALRDKLVIAGVQGHPNGHDQQRCMECMYFVVHRKWCGLPELSLPVEPSWWCRMWRG